MPLYEYECVANGHRFELIRKFSDPELKTCIRCKSKVKRLPSAPAIAFKGSGWYVTDYARGGGAKGSSSRDKAGSSESESSSKEASKPSDEPGKSNKKDRKDK